MRFINHDPKKPNVDFVTRVIDITHGFLPVVAVIANDFIVPNTEMTVNYKAGEVGGVISGLG